MDHIPTTPARALAQPPTSARWHPRFDLAGAWLSLACAAHCIALPLLLAFVPAAMMALRSFQHPGHGAMTVLLIACGGMMLAAAHIGNRRALHNR